jgi:2-desacetyl-2-hydroxyethyl bacteriochlorophyllide A dehydrogenase
MNTTQLETIRAMEWMFEAPGRLERIQATLPRPAVGEVLVRTKLGAISPGTERTLLHGAAPSVPASSYPHQPGYLNVVTIMEAADRSLVGDRGVAILGHRDMALLPYSRFIRVPPGAPDELALLGVLAADARHAIDTADPKSGEECLVVGGGILGVLTAWEIGVKTRGRVRLLETDPKRQTLLGEIRWPGPVEIASDAGRVHYATAFDCACSPDAFRTIQSAMRPTGSILLIADGSHDDYVLSGEFFSKGLFLGKTNSHPDLRAFLGEWFARSDDRTTLLDVAFRDDVHFADFPQSYLEALLAPPSERKGLVPRVLYP